MCAICFDTFCLLETNNRLLTSFFSLSGNRSRPTTQSDSTAIKTSADSNSATIDDPNDIERIDRISKKKMFFI
jgi:hypothetical protein